MPPYKSGSLDWPVIKLLCCKPSFMLGLLPDFLTKANVKSTYSLHGKSFTELWTEPRGLLVLCCVHVWNCTALGSIAADWVYFTSRFPGISSSVMEQRNGLACRENISLRCRHGEAESWQSQFSYDRVPVLGVPYDRVLVPGGLVCRVLDWTIHHAVWPWWCINLTSLCQHRGFAILLALGFHRPPSIFLHLAKGCELFLQCWKISLLQAKLYLVIAV